MRYSFASLALAALAAANPMPQGVTSAIAPSSSDPAGCSSSYSGKFEIQVVNVTGSSKREVQKRTALVLSLADGVLTDAESRTGYIASNYQFQFDGPPQTGAIYTAGWSVCTNGSLALGDSSIFYQCLSGTFYNLYDESTGAQCSEVYIDVISTGSSSSAAVSQTADGQVTGSAVASQQTDGQVTAASAAAVTQISDGQVQAVSTSSTAAAVSQISDGQVQATTAAASAAAVSQISDGQVQATTAAPVTQISDGQIQASATTTGAAVSQISDGQIQASGGSNTTVASATASAVAYTGAAMPTAIRGELFGIAAGVLAIAML
ncbi:hypothetical protein LTR36_010727 [Oleoguttula mirabilis]|uniref:Cell wall mannoprotein PIR1-like C-terminal domain-containing protein n=1 Tax=Oleoguttula mirabilis TaxID=1507867 RepID=A0AAV9JRJ1_9PEZI|nr:hypothetical protein LTR36_010727 [Oleoguttula mirabilis]